MASFFCSGVLQDLPPLLFFENFCFAIILWRKESPEILTHLVTRLVTRLVDLVWLVGGVTRLIFFPLALIKCAYKGPSFEFNLMFYLCSNTFKVERLSAGCTKYPFGTIKTVCKDNIAISQKLFFNSNLVHGLFIAYKALPPKALTGISMQIGVQITWHSKTIFEAGQIKWVTDSTIKFWTLERSFGKPSTHKIVHIVSNQFQWKGNQINVSNYWPGLQTTGDPLYQLLVVQVTGHVFGRETSIIAHIQNFIWLSYRAGHLIHIVIWYEKDLCHIKN